MAYSMWPINFLPWHEKKQIYYRRRYCKIAGIILWVFFSVQVVSMLYFQNKLSESKAVKILATPQVVVKKHCEDKFLQSLTLQAILVANEKYKIITRDQSGKTMVLPVQKMNCWKVAGIENDKIKLENVVSQKIILWKLGETVNGNS